MKLKLALLAAAGTMAFLPAANAQEGWYGSLGAGYTFSNDKSDFEDRDGTMFVTDYDLDEGINIYGAIGKYLAYDMRGELEFATRSQNVDELKGDGLGFGGFLSDGNLGTVHATTLMGNLYKDFNVGTGFTPYLGVGAGVARFRSEIDNSTDFTSANFPVPAGSPWAVGVNDNDYAIAGQAMAGLVFDLAENIDVDVRYRYLQTGDIEYQGFINENPNLVDLKTIYKANELTAGFRWNFGAAPAPAPAPAPTPAPIQYKDCWDGSKVMMSQECPPEITEEPVAAPDLDLTVYFDYDKSNLTNAAQSLIAAKAAEALEYSVTGVAVSGNTDSSGSAAYNNALSARRAAVVRDALIGNGIDGSIISVQALGESNPAKPTADGVREPLNRRTEVDFSF
ncbi:MAG: OmpA family protein [bacterium]